MVKRSLNGEGHKTSWLFNAEFDKKPGPSFTAERYPYFQVHIMLSIQRRLLGLWKSPKSFSNEF